MANTADTGRLVEFLVKSLVEDVEAASVSTTESESGDTVTFEITVAADDVGKIIGRQGRIIKSIRTLARAADRPPARASRWKFSARCLPRVRRSHPLLG